MTDQEPKKHLQSEANKRTFLDSLTQINEKAKKKSELKLREVFKVLAGKGYATLLILFSFPFCIPITIPGFSTPFGIVLCFLGLRIAFAKKLWWPKWILEKALTSEQVGKWTERAISIVQYMQKMLHPRLVFLIKNPLFYRLHGLTIFMLALLLSLPLPIPFSNMLAALPLFFMGLGLLEDDGLMIIISHILALLCFLAFLALFLLGKAQLAKVHLT